MLFVYGCHGHPFCFFSTISLTPAKWSTMFIPFILFIVHFVHVSIFYVFEKIICSYRKTHYFCTRPTRQPSDGGEFSVVALAWLQWQLKGDQQAAKMFVGKNNLLQKREDWTLEKNKKLK